MNNIIYRVIRKIYLLTTPKNKIRKIRLGVLKGMKWIYSSGYTDYWMGTYEKEVAEIFSKYAKKSKVIYDLGANIGYYSLIAIKSIKNNGTVYAFEPAPENINILKQHKFINNIDNLTIFELAISNKTGNTLFTNTENHVANTICTDSCMFRGEKQ